MIEAIYTHLETDGEKCGPRTDDSGRAVVDGLYPKRDDGHKQVKLFNNVGIRGVY